MEERVTGLEIHLTHLERTVQELNDMVYRQQRTIDRLEAELKGLREQVTALAPSTVGPLEEEEPPPHW